MLFANVDIQFGRGFPSSAAGVLGRFTSFSPSLPTWTMLLSKRDCPHPP